eukprot:TRINITY_DN32147_c0_g1_i1.p1 TRINITY_DN32147_c0_g1~~TRINITY_DN32147_c0_g1_i1.p1  ORF type:complete len:1081 (-),score=187.32 TRINITY_DN32147_c0_g1_i1:149-3391(-)
MGSVDNPLLQPDVIKELAWQVVFGSSQLPASPARSWTGGDAETSKGGILSGEQTGHGSRLPRRAAAERSSRIVDPGLLAIQASPCLEEEADERGEVSLFSLGGCAAPSPLDLPLGAPEVQGRSYREERLQLQLQLAPPGSPRQATELRSPFSSPRQDESQSLIRSSPDASPSPRSLPWRRPEGKKLPVKGAADSPKTPAKIVKPVRREDLRKAKQNEEQQGKAACRGGSSRIRRESPSRGYGAAKEQTRSAKRDDSPRRQCLQHAWAEPRRLPLQEVSNASAPQIFQQLQQESDFHHAQDSLHAALSPKSRAAAIAAKQVWASPENTSEAGSSENRSSSVGAAKPSRRPASAATDRVAGGAPFGGEINSRRRLAFTEIPQAEASFSAQARRPSLLAALMPSASHASDSRHPTSVSPPRGMQAPNSARERRGVSSELLVPVKLGTTVPQTIAAAAKVRSKSVPALNKLASETTMAPQRVHSHVFEPAQYDTDIEDPDFTVGGEARDEDRDSEGTPQQSELGDSLQKSTADQEAMHAATSRARAALDASLGDIGLTPRTYEATKQRIWSVLQGAVSDVFPARRRAGVDTAAQMKSDGEDEVSQDMATGVSLPRKAISNRVTKERSASPQEVVARLTSMYCGNLRATSRAQQQQRQQQSVSPDEKLEMEEQFAFMLGEIFDTMNVQEKEYLTSRELAFLMKQPDPEQAAASAAKRCSSLLQDLILKLRHDELHREDFISTWLSVMPLEKTADSASRQLLQILDHKAWSLRTTRMKSKKAKETGQQPRAVTLGDWAVTRSRTRQDELKKMGDLQHGLKMEEVLKSQEARGYRRAQIFKQRRERLNLDIETEEEKAMRWKKERARRRKEEEEEEEDQLKGRKSTIDFLSEKPQKQGPSTLELWGVRETPRYQTMLMPMRGVDHSMTKAAKTQKKSPKAMFAAAVESPPIADYGTPTPASGVADAKEHTDLSKFNIKNLRNVTRTVVELEREDLAAMKDIIQCVEKADFIDLEERISRHPRTDDAASCRSAFMQALQAPCVDRHRYNLEHFWTCSFEKRLRMQGISGDSGGGPATGNRERVRKGTM